MIIALHKVLLISDEGKMPKTATILKEFKPFFQ
jgi:hypothetical protein